MGNMSKFQVIILGVFGILIIVSVIIFSKYQGGGVEQAEVSIWGNVNPEVFQSIISKTSLYNNEAYKISYSYKEEALFDDEYVEALASGNGPDLFLLPHDKIVKQKNKITLIPYDAFSERMFKDSFIEGSEIYLDPTGIVALPVIVDPLVMYWSRKVFTDAKLTSPPKYWDEFYSLAGLISKKDGALNIQKSLVSFGEYNNVSNAKAIISNLMMQAGTPIVQRFGDDTRSVMADSFEKPVIPGEAAVNFYTEFSNPVKPYYSWNRSMPLSQTYFLSGDMALYFGFASEIALIQLKNPNLNFDVSSVPTSKDSGNNVSYGKFYGFAISRGSKNANAAFGVASILSSREGALAISEALGVPPARRDLLGTKALDANQAVFYESALRSKAWLDPEPTATAKIFANMIESITSGRERTSAAVVKASREITELFK